jgi:hypothetical protein
MMKDAGHFDQIRRLRVSDKDLSPFTAAYDVRKLVGSSHNSGVCAYIYFRLHLFN